MSFQEPDLKADGATALGAALQLLSNKLDIEVKKCTPKEKGDWRPLVFLMTDGQPTDNWQKGADELKKRKATVIACAAGFEADRNILKQITENVLELKTISTNDIVALFELVTIISVVSTQKFQMGREEGIALGELSQLQLPSEINPESSRSTLIHF